jgi:transcription elongation GreA/GreB family factor
MEKELRKDKRTDKLANLEKNTEVSLKKIAAKANLSKEIAGLSEKAEQAALKRFNAILASDLSETKITAALIGVLHDVIKTDAAAATGQGGKAFTAPEKQVDELINKLFGVTVHTDGSLRFGGEFLTSDMPQYQKYTGALKTGRRVYKQTLVKTGDQRIAQLAAEDAVHKFMGSSTQAGNKIEVGDTATNAQGKKMKWDGQQWVPVQ